MSDSLHEHAKQIFLEALDLPAAERDGFISERCDGREDLRAMVVELVAADEGADDAVFLGAPTLHDVSATGSLSTITVDTPRGPMREIEVPTQLGPIAIGREIGHGATGVVYHGRDEMLDRHVAVKFLRFVPETDAGADIEAFCDGVRRACRLSHPGLTSIYAANTHDGLPYIIMEYVDGPSLRDIVRKNGPMDIRAVVVIARRMCEAVGALHDGGIVHRDIKPGNVMLTTDGRVVVTDFGLACDRPWGTIGDRMERVAGTPAYMAPEMFEGAVSTRTDVFALGVTIYELATGRLPFGDSFSSIRDALEADEPEIDVSDIPEDLAEIILRSTRKNPLYRYKNARRMFDALERLPGRDYAGTNLVGIAEIGNVERSASSDPEDGSSGSYYETISRLAERHKKVRDPEDVQAEAEAAATEQVGLPWCMPCRRCGGDLQGIEESSVCRACGYPVGDSLHDGCLLGARPSVVASISQGVVAMWIVTILVPYAMWVSMLPGAGALIGAVGAAALLGVGAVVAAAQARTALRLCRETSLGIASVAQCLMYVTSLGAVVTMYLLSGSDSMVARIVAMSCVTLSLLACLITTALPMAVIRGIDRRGLISTGPGYVIWLLVGGLPGPIILGAWLSMLMTRGVDDQGESVHGLNLLVTIIVTGATVSAWCFAALMLAAAQRTLIGLRRLARERAPASDVAESASTD